MAPAASSSSVAAPLTNQAVELLLEHRPTTGADGKPPTKTKIILYYLATLLLLCVIAVITGLAEWISTSGSLTYLKVELDCVLGKVFSVSSAAANCTVLTLKNAAGSGDDL